MTRRRTSRGSGKTQRRYWDGLQFPSTAIPTTRLILVLVDAVASEFMDRTVVSVRGFLNYHATGSDSDNGIVRVASKLVGARFIDAGTIAEDVQPIDTHEEDIATRQLWTHSCVLAGSPAGAEFRASGAGILNLEINVKVKIRMTPDGKMRLVLIIEADVPNRALVAGYLRVLTVR